MHTVHTLDDVPTFASEDEEAAFWSTHEFGAELLAQMQPLPPGLVPPSSAETEAITLLLDRTVVERVKALARGRRQGYHSLLREFITDRLCQETEHDT